MNDALRRQAVSSSKRPFPPLPAFPIVADNASKSRSVGSKKRENTPLGWQEFFDEKRMIETDNGRFNVYFKGTTGPILFLLHGGGYSGLTWACVAEEITKIADFRIVAPDLRGHGDTSTQNELELSTEQQIDDIGQIYKKVIEYFRVPPPPVIVMGHSMGGALAVHAAAKKDLIPNLVALIVVDVVEGSAIEALHYMHNFLRNRPAAFKTEEAAIDWCGTVRNGRSARVSMPAQLKAIGADTVDRLQQDDASALSEQDEDAMTMAGDQQKSSGTQSENGFTWRIDLLQTDQFWKGWFTGLSVLFLSVPVPKMLLLAGTDRLDKDLTIGQMQGKFQMVVLPKVGHALQEDSPDKVAETVAGFCIRNKFVEANNKRPTPFKPSLPGC